MRICAHACRPRFDPPKGSIRVIPNVKFSKIDIYLTVADIMKISGPSRFSVQRFFALKVALPPGTPDNFLPTRKAGWGRPRKMTSNVIAALKRTFRVMPMLSARDLKAKHVRLLHNIFAVKAALPPGTLDHVLPER